MGLLRMAARTAVVAGTATAVSGRVQRRQAAKWDAQDSSSSTRRSRSSTRRSRSRAAPAPEDDDRTAPEAGGAAHPGRAHR